MSLPKSPFLSAQPPQASAEKAPASSAWYPDDVGVTDCIAEIFRGAEKLNDPEARFVLDVERFLADVEDVPLFLRRATG